MSTTGSMSISERDGAIVVLCAEEVVRASIAYWSASFLAPTVVAEDGYHANRILKEEACLLLVTDRILPPWPGLDTFMQLRERHPRLRIVFVEGARRDDVGLARLIGATDVLPRPLKRQSLIDAFDAARRS
jgi:DNA-binding response OmpR family regulator